MMRFFTIRLCLLIFIFGVFCKTGISQSIFTNPITGTDPSTSNPYTIGQIYDPNITVSGIGRGPAITAATANDRYSAKSWSTAAIDLSKYFEFTITPNFGYSINFLSFVYTGQVSGAGTPSFAFRSSLDAFASDIGTPTTTGTTINLTNLIYQNITSPVTFRFYVFNVAATTTTYSINDFTFNRQPQYFKSAVITGDWSNSTTWVSSINNTTYTYQKLIPGLSDKTITVINGTTVSVNTPVALDETIVMGTLQVLNGGVLNINHPATGNDIDIKNNGVFQVLSTSAYSVAIVPGTSVINVATGGKILIGDGTVAVGLGYEGFAASSTNIWNNASLFEWNTPTDFVLGGNTYFPNAGPATIPKFIVSKVTGPIGGAGGVTINGLLTINSNFAISTTGLGSKDFRNGISGNSTLTLNNTGGLYNITSSTSEISGNLTLVLLRDIHLNNGTTIPSGSTIIVSNTSSQGFVRDAGDFIIAANARLEMGTTATITNTAAGSVIVNGTFATARMGGFFGGGSTIPSGLVILNGGCTVEFNATGLQSVFARPDYQNMTFSGSGNKVPSSAFTPAGTVYITGSAILNASMHNIGDSSGNGIKTNLTMDGSSRLILGTTGTQPMMAGIYMLTGGVVQFDGVSAQTIRTRTYQNIEVTQTGVGNSNGNITLNTNGTFTVKSGGVFVINDNNITGIGGTQIVTVENGGIFRSGNNEGFNGFPATLSNNSSIHQNITNIILNPGSTVEYMRAGDQPITNSNGLVYQNLLISGTGNKKAPSGLLRVKGNLIKSGISSFLHNGGIVLLNGNNQTFAGLTYNNLILSNGNIKTTSGTSTLIDSLKISTSTTLNLAGSDSIILHSDALKTARVGQVDGSIAYPGAGRFVVERYISSKRAWRFLSVPTNTGQNFNTAWQEGKMPGTKTQTTPAGYGTQITDKVAPSPGNGFDYYSNNGPSVKKFDPNTNTWVGIAGTYIPIQTTEGLMTFVRGDRTAQGFYATPTPTVLRTYGPIYIGTRAFIPITAGKFASIGNPYPSPIDMRTIQRTFGQVDSFFYVWDPKLTSGLGFGAFQTFTQIGGNYYPTPGGGSYPTTGSYNLIASGQAFFVHGKTSGSGGQFTMQETDKNYNDVPNAFRPENTLLRNNLYVIDADSSASLVDGVLNVIGDTYSNSVDEKDAIKIANFAENLAIKKEDKLLSVEKRHSIIERDTIFYNLTKVKVAPYRFEINADNFSSDNIKASFEDVYLDTKTPVDLKGTTMVNFKITSDSASWNPDRFRMIFEKINKLPEPGINALINVYPNPVKNNTINLYLVKQPKNTFQVNLINISGQVIYTKKITHEEGSSSETIYLKKSVPKGNYLLNITDEHNNKRVITITK